MSPQNPGIYVLAECLAKVETTKAFCDTARNSAQITTGFAFWNRYL